MKDRPKLGRGLRDVSQFFLSGPSQDGQHHNELLSPTHRTRTVCIFSPASPLIQSFFTANLALEMARHRFETRVLDYSMSDDARVKTLMRSLLDEEDLEPDRPAGIILYGLPRIEITDRVSEGFFAGTETQEAAHDTMKHEEDCLTLVNAGPNLDFIMMSEPFDHSIIITRTDGMSLLQAYAFIKVLNRRSQNSDVWVIFDGEEGSDHQRIFGLLSGFVDRHLGKAVGFLGTLVHDESMEQSIREEKPLVLQARMSVAREALTGICSRFVERRLRKEGEADS